MMRAHRPQEGLFGLREWAQEGFHPQAPDSAHAFGPPTKRFKGAGLALGSISRGPRVPLSMFQGVEDVDQLEMSQYPGNSSARPVRRMPNDER